MKPTCLFPLVHGQIFASYNKGMSWEEVAANQSQTPVFSLWPCEDDGYLYIGINVDAVYKRPLDQFTGSKISNENDPIIVYPNPVKEHLFIDTGTQIDKCSVKIYNAKGQLIVSKSLLNEESFIDMTRLS